MTKTVFLDRDGVLNIRSDTYVKTPDEFIILPNIASFIKKLKDAGYQIIVVTNQSCVNRGLTTNENVNKIHSKLQNHLRENNLALDAIYYCPHRPDENCGCRKPKTGLFENATKDFEIDPKESWMIGDTDSDMESGKKFGCKTIKIDKNTSFEDAINIILNS